VFFASGTCEFNIFSGALGIGEGGFEFIGTRS